MFSRVAGEIGVFARRRVRQHCLSVARCEVNVSGEVRFFVPVNVVCGYLYVGCKCLTGGHETGFSCESKGSQHAGVDGYCIAHISNCAVGDGYCLRWGYFQGKSVGGEDMRAVVSHSHKSVFARRRVREDCLSVARCEVNRPGIVRFLVSISVISRDGDA